MDDVPFFDVHLPYELAINIFQYLNRRELGLCAQVSCCSPVSQGPQLCPRTVDLQTHTVTEVMSCRAASLRKAGLNPRFLFHIPVWFLSSGDRLLYQG